ncbi:hypothetical protein [Actinomyces marmotae]|uniref:hypothetical protein n=1 Tax=Actinomyces marmotae TaxID=2737173 RepID=UPI001357275C|nr:hypothetical protein [Actinomyces marmotae]
MPCKTADKRIDSDHLRQEAANLAEAIAERAERAAEWAAPRVVRAGENVSRAAKEAQTRIEPAYSEARARVVDDYLPRAQRAAEAARAAIAEAPAPVVAPKKHRCRRGLKALAWATVVTAAAGAAYIAWRRSQPVEDPWAEEYWADSAEEGAEFLEEVTGA